MKEHGTKIVLYNLWEDDQGQLELDIDTDPYVSSPEILSQKCSEEVVMFEVFQNYTCEFWML